MSFNQMPGGSAEINNENNVRVKNFLKNNGLDVDSIDTQKILDDMLHHMDEGLAGRESSLLMLPTYVNAGRPIDPVNPVIAMDTGGTNFRTAHVQFDKEGVPEISEIIRKGMPGAKSEVNNDQFYGEIIGAIDLLNGKSPLDQVRRLGFTFSYPFEAIPRPDGSIDAKLLRWTKEIKAPRIRGRELGRDLKARFVGRYGIENITFVNDTVATLLAAKIGKPFDANTQYVGGINGTGTNFALNMPVNEIANVDHSILVPGQERMVVNTELGNFSEVPQSAFDKKVDDSTEKPGEHKYEKMISGGYLGEVGLVVLKEATKSLSDLFSESAKNVIGSLQSLEKKHLDAFCAGIELDDGDPNPLDQITNPNDVALIKELAMPLFVRSAKLIAVSAAATILKSDSPHVRVNIDGSNHYKTKSVAYEEIFKQEVDGLVTSRNDSVEYEFARVEEASLVGAAALAASIG